MANRLDVRLGRLERSSQGASTEYVVFLQPGETQDQAIARHRAATGYQGGVVMVDDPTGDGGKADLSVSEWIAQYAPDQVGVAENKSATNKGQDDNMCERQERRGE